jgi:hypothetical protein
MESAKKGWIKASDVVEIVASPDVQANFTRIGICKPVITERTVQNWLKKLDWHYKQSQNGIYIDGHERDNVVQYRKAFIEQWKAYDKRFHQWDDDGNLCPLPQGFPIPGGRFHLILVTHDELTFYQNDERKVAWAHPDKAATPKQKGEGQSIMVSDFLTVEWGRLCDGNK